MLNKIDGNKTYIIMLAAIVYAVAGVLAGFHDVQSAVQIILAALGLGGIRSALKKTE